MRNKAGFDRREFLKVAGVSAAATMIPANVSASAGAQGVKYDFDEVVDRVGTHCLKWDRTIRQYGEGKIQVAMGIADMDFRVAPAISAAIQERVRHDVWGYGSTAPSLREAIVDWNKRRHGEELDTELIVFCAGVHEGIISSLRAVAPEGGTVVLLTPAYSTFYSDIKKGGCTPVECPLKFADGRYEMDFDAVEQTIGEKSRALILCNPNNPTGNCWTAADMTTLGEICVRRGVTLLADEVHGDITRDDAQYTPFATLENETVVRNSVTLKSCGKPFNLAGHKISYFYSGNAELISQIRGTGHNEWLNSLGYIASEAALRGGEEWLDQVVGYIDQSMNFVDEYVREKLPLTRFVKPQGTYLAWLDFSDFFTKIGAAEMAGEANKQLDAAATPYSVEEYMQDYFVEHAGVHLNDGHRYGPGSAGYMRMNIATSRKRVQLALDNLRTVISNA